MHISKHLAVTGTMIQGHFSWPTKALQWTVGTRTRTLKTIVYSNFTLHSALACWSPQWRRLYYCGAFSPRPVQLWRRAVGRAGHLRPRPASSGPAIGGSPPPVRTPYRRSRRYDHLQGCSRHPDVCNTSPKRHQTAGFAVHLDLL